jgi:Protein of unknown function (DUF3365).
MSLRLKFNLVLAAVLLVAVAGAGLYVHRFLQNAAVAQVQHNSAIMMHAALAIRDYTTELVKPHLDVTLLEKFLPQTVPAFAATETLRRLQTRFPGYEYKEAVLNPSNLRDRATEWEARLIEDFRSGRADLQTEVTGEIGKACTARCTWRGRSPSSSRSAWPATARPRPRRPACARSTATTTALAGR